ncbi:TPA: BON domain-containing protein [Legionella pneumophila]|nr:BON domain-containing protein [Legionella pneumophila]HAT8817006.1 BON domain-containing protein [Legionella pneumophila subsp. pneumophila]HAT6805611.1 BON domain-containing protein [Legionella pneumophila]HAT6817672.1 BON domain-containing protein [Legionella pneumophila]HAT6827215.1 BON domain-containing protein [Legionella pneumophila]
MEDTTMPKCMHFILATALIFVTSTFYASNLLEIEQEVSDSVITAKITAKFAESRHLNPLKISIDTEKGIVTLSGYAPDKQAFIDALQIAKNTKGVKAVHAKDLHIKKVNTAFTDAFITAEVETAVLKAKILDDESIPLVGINASTTNGEVTLSGHVKSARSIAAIIKRVNEIPGVKKIVTNLEIQENT